VVHGLFEPMHLLLLFGAGLCLLVVLLVALLFKRASQQPPVALGIQARVERLAALKEQSLLSDEEYQAKRRQLLDQL
jgi:hypothetical protein